MPPRRTQKTPTPKLVEAPILVEEPPLLKGDATVSDTPVLDGPIGGNPNDMGAFEYENDPREKSDPGILIDEEIPEEKRAEILPDRKRTAPKSGAPTLDEWQNFFSRIVVRFLTDGYIAYAFRGIDENLLSERDVQKLKMTKEERDRIAVPFAEYANKSPFARKHGRQVVAAVDSIESVATLAIWMGRVNRISRKYRPQKPQTRTTTNKAANDVSARQAESNGTGPESGNVRIFNPHI